MVADPTGLLGFPGGLWGCRDTRQRVWERPGFLVLPMIGFASGFKHS
jgi:hypothetical protein